MSGVGVDPCLNADGVPPPLGLDDPADLPRRILGTRLAKVLKMASGLAADLPELIWSEPPPPVQACQELEYLGDWLRRLSLAADEARTHVELLWELSAGQASERRSHPALPLNAESPRSDAR